MQQTATLERKSGGFDVAYHVVSDKPQQESSNNRTKDLSNPIVEGFKDRDPSTKKSTKSDSRVHVSTRNMSTDRNSSK